MPEKIFKRFDSSSGIWLLSLPVLALLLRLPVVFFPFFNGDEATYSAIANSILHGSFLYSEVVDHKPPLIYLTYAAILSLTDGFGVLQVKLASVMVIVATAMMLARIAVAAGRPVLEARLSGLWYVIFSAMGPGKDMLAANAEIFMMLPTAAAIWCFLKKGSPGWLVGAGIWSAIAFLYKYQGGAVLGGLAFAVLAEESSWPRKWRRLLLLGTGFILPLGVFVGLYLVRGELDPLYFWGWSFPRSYAGLLSWEQITANGLVMTAKWAVPNCMLLLAAVSGGMRLCRHRDSRTYFILLSCCLFWSVLGVASGGRFTMHYYIQLLPPLSLLAAAGPTRTVGSVGLALPLPGLRRVMPVRLVAFMVLVPLVIFWSLNLIDHRVRPKVAEYTKTYLAVGEWLREHGEPGDTLFVWGNSPEIYFFSRMMMGTRFVFCNYQSGKIWGTRYDEEGATGTERMAVEPAWQMLLADLHERRPLWVVDGAAGGLDRWQGHALPRYGRLWQVIASRYALAAEIEGTMIYHLRND